MMTIGIDIGGTNIKYGLVDDAGHVSHRGNLVTADYHTIPGLVSDLHNRLADVLAAFPVRGIGIGAPNANYHTGNIEHAANLQWTGIVPVAQPFSETFGVPCALTNDANAAALGEMKFGMARGMNDFIVITLGTGVGSGIVSNGQLVAGHDGFAGELGHCVIIRGGRLHHRTGLRGTLESYASATGVVETAREMMENDHAGSGLRSVPLSELTSRKIFEAAQRGDKLATEVFKFTGQVLGEALAIFVHFSSPEAIIFFGGLAHAGDLLMKPVREAMEANLLQNFKGKVKLLQSSLPEADAAILGAASLV